MIDCGDTYAEQVDKGNFSGWLCFISVACAAAAFAEWVACLGNLPSAWKGLLPCPIAVRQTLPAAPESVASQASCAVTKYCRA
jgi:hypothetical protein